MTHFIDQDDLDHLILTNINVIFGEFIGVDTKFDEYCEEIYPMLIEVVRRTVLGVARRAGVTINITK